MWGPVIERYHSVFRFPRAFFYLLTSCLLFVSPHAALARISAGTNVNVSLRAGNEAEPTVAMDPSNPAHVFIASNINAAGLLISISTDSGASWATSIIADNTDNLPQACCDATAAFDTFGNLWLTYLGHDTHVKIALSTDTAQTWSDYADLGKGDEPTIAAAKGEVWVTFHNSAGSITAAGASVSGLGTATAFNTVEVAPGSSDGHYGDIAIGPGGEVLVTYQVPSHGEGPGNIYVNLDPDGLGAAPFQSAVRVTGTNVGGFDFIPAQSGRSVDAESGLAWDRSGGLYNNRIYLVYTGESPDESNNMDILLRYSDNKGSTWSGPLRVNDDVSSYSQFLSHLAIDETTGDIAISWYDCRNDTGAGPDDTNGIPNDDAEMYATISNDGGVSVLPPVKVSGAPSNAADSQGRYDYGDYDGLAFQGGAFFPVWADNSNSTGDNPDGALSHLEIYTSRIVDNSGGPQLGLTPSRLPDGVVNFYYDQDIVPHGGTPPYSFVPSGTIPTGLSLNCTNASCTLSGDPTASGPFSFAISTSDSDGHSGIRNYDLQVAAGCLYCDDFQDDVLSSSWTYLKPSWAETGGALVGTPTGRLAATVATPAFAGCTSCSVEVSVQTTGGPFGKVWLLAWRQSNRDDVELLIKQDSDRWILRQRVNGVIAIKAKAVSAIAPNTSYDVKLVYDGTNFTLYVDGAGLIVMPAAAVPSGTVGFEAKNTTASFGFVLVN